VEEFKSGRVQDELEFKRNSKMIHGGAACSFTRQRAEESSDLDGAHCGVPFFAKDLMKLLFTKGIFGGEFCGLLNVDDSTLCMRESDKA